MIRGLSSQRHSSGHPGAVESLGDHYYFECEGEGESWRFDPLTTVDMIALCVHVYACMCVHVCVHVCMHACACMCVGVHIGEMRTHIEVKGQCLWISFSIVSPPYFLRQSVLPDVNLMYHLDFSDQLR